MSAGMHVETQWPSGRERYPTVDAYERACAALRRVKAENERLRAIIKELGAAEAAEPAGEEPPDTLSAKDLQSRVEGDLLILDDDELVVHISAEIGPHPVARERLRQLAVNALALAEVLK